MTQINKREGAICKVEGVRCFSWPIMASHGDGERVEIFVVEVGGRKWKVGEGIGSL